LFRFEAEFNGQIDGEGSLRRNIFGAPSFELALDGRIARANLGGFDA